MSKNTDYETSYIYNATDYTIKPYFSKNALKLQFISHVKFPPINLKYEYISKPPTNLKYKCNSTHFLDLRNVFISKYTPDFIIKIFEKKYQTLSQREYVFVTLMLEDILNKYIDYFLLHNIIMEYGY